MIWYFLKHKKWYMNLYFVKIISRIFIAWKNRFKILQQAINHYDIVTQVKTFIAYVVLHNYLREGVIKYLWSMNMKI